MNPHLVTGALVPLAYTRGPRLPLARWAAAVTLIAPDSSRPVHPVILRTRPLTPG
jgi:hypothetical protein